jgi:ribonuclease HI
LYTVATVALRNSSQNWKTSVQVTFKNLAEIRWWKRNILMNTPFFFRRLAEPQASLITDASSIGWGAILQIQDRQWMTWGRYQSIVSQQSSNYREITAVLLALRFFQTILLQNRVRCLKIQSDNQTTVFILNKVKAKNRLLAPARKIFSILARTQIQIIAEHLPGVQNSSADALSRLEIAGDYQLDKDIFQSGLQTIQMFPEIDLFATEENHLLPRFVTVKRSMSAIAVNAFSINWNNLSIYLHPPIILISKCLQKIIHDKAEAVIVTPQWQGQTWWPLLQQITVRKVELGKSTEVLSPGFLMKSRNLKLPPGKLIMSKVSYKLFQKENTGK